MPITKPTPEIEFREIKDEEKTFSAFHSLRRVRFAKIFIKFIVVFMFKLFILFAILGSS